MPATDRLQSHQQQVFHLIYPKADRWQDCLSPYKDRLHPETDELPQDTGHHSNVHRKLSWPHDLQNSSRQTLP